MGKLYEKVIYKSHYIEYNTKCEFNAWVRKEKNMGLEAFDNYECEGQMSIEDLYNIELDVPQSIFAVSKIFARARKQMNLPEMKAFTYALTNLRFTEENGNKLLLDKKTMAKIVGINSDTDHLSTDLIRSIGNLPKHSHIELNYKDFGFYENGFVVTNVRMYKNKVKIIINPDYMTFFSKLEKDYITMWSGDIFGMSSERSIEFYEQLRLNTDTREGVNQADVGVKWFKDLFNIPKEGKGSYMTKDGHFSRTHFEKYVIDPLCEDVAKCRMINLIRQADGKYYEKVKKNGRVIAYRFNWTYTSHPRVATAQEVKAIQDRVDKNPQVLKMAKDILEGEKVGQKKKKSKNSFHDFEQRDYDMEELERILLGR